MSRFNNPVINQYGIQILDAHPTYQNFIAEHPTGNLGDAHLVGTHLYSWNHEQNAWVDAGEIVGPAGEDGTDGVDGVTPFTILGEYNNGADYTYGDAVYYNGGTYVRTGNPLNPGYPPTPGEINASWTPIADKGDSVDLQSVAENILPSVNNTFYLGSSTYRWAGIYVGPGTIHITDTVTGQDATLNVSSGVLTINGANQLQVGQLKFVDNKIQSTTPSVAIEIGQTTDTANLTLNRNTKIASGKKLSFGNGTRADIDPSLAPWGKQTCCVKVTAGKSDMYWGSCASNGITGGTDYYILATFINT
jgi:signal peptidase I